MIIKSAELRIDKFLGAMTGKTNKGVFVTTSDFVDTAISKVEEAQADKKVILIGGSKLIGLDV